MKKIILVIILTAIFIINCYTNESENNIKRNNDKTIIYSLLKNNPYNTFSSYTKLNYPRIRLMLAVNAAALTTLFLISTAISSILTYFYVWHKEDFANYDSSDDNYKEKENLVISYLISLCVMWSVTSLTLITSIILWSIFGIIYYKIFSKNIEISINCEKKSMCFGLSWKL